MSALVTPGLGDIACLQISGQVGELIDVGEWLCGDAFHRYQHVEIYVGEVNGVPSTFGAYPGGADYKPLPPAADQGQWLWSTGHIELTDEQRQGIVATCASLKGTPYSALDYFAIAAHRLHVPDIGGELRNYISDSKHLICSQLVDYVYMKNDIHLFSDKRWEGYVTPADIAQVILHPELIELGSTGA